MEFDKKYTIQFSGLKEGKHLYDFEIDGGFFSPFTDEKYAVEMAVKLNLEKLSTMLILHFDLAGVWNTECDKCGDSLAQPIEGKHKLFAKFGEGESEDEDVLILPVNEYEINVSPFIYEYFMVNIPFRKVHKKGSCNEEVIKKLTELSPQNGNKGLNPVWDKLKNLS